jgi:hypothetical protein
MAVEVKSLRLLDIPQFKDGSPVGSSTALELILDGFTFLMSKDDAKQFDFFDSETSVRFSCICFKMDEKEFFSLKNAIAEFIRDA